MIKKYEKQILEAYLNLPSTKLLKHQFEIEEDYLAGYVSRFLHGERFDEDFVPFSDYELKAEKSSAVCVYCVGVNPLPCLA